MGARAVASAMDGAGPGASAAGAAAAGRPVAGGGGGGGGVAGGDSMEETNTREMELRNVRQEIRLRRGLK
jgi:hypothetical protein